MTTATKAQSIVEQANKMAADGYGAEDVSVRLKIPLATAYWYVFKKPRRRQQ